MGDLTSIGTILLAIIPAIIPAIIGLLQSWLSRGKGRTVKFRGKVGDQAVEFEGNVEELEELLRKLTDESKSSKGN